MTPRKLGSIGVRQGKIPGDALDRRDMKPSLRLKARLVDNALAAGGSRPPELGAILRFDRVCAFLYLLAPVVAKSLGNDKLWRSRQTWRCARSWSETGR